MNPLAARMVGIVRSPRTTLAALATVPRAPWLDVLAASTLAMFLGGAALLATPVGQTALVDRWERTATAFGTPVDDARYARLQELSRYGVAYAAGVALLTGPALTFVVALVIVAWFGRDRTPRAPVTSVLSMVAHAGVILAVRQVVTAPFNYLTETLGSPITLGQFVPGMDETSILARFLGVIDVFVIWWAIVLAFGVALLIGRRALPLALTFTGVYVGIALLVALAMAATGGTT